MMGNIFAGSVTDWGFDISDIWSSSMGIFGTLAVFIVLGIVIGFAPQLMQLVRAAIIFKRYNEPWLKTDRHYGFKSYFIEFKAKEYHRQQNAKYKPWRNG